MGGKGRPAKFPCWVCNGAANAGVIGCSHCESWAHFSCLHGVDPGTAVLEVVLKFCEKDFVKVSCPVCLNKKCDNLEALETKVNDLCNILKATIPNQSDAEATVTTNDGSSPKVPSFADVVKMNLIEQKSMIVEDLKKSSEDDQIRRSLVISGLKENGKDLDDVRELCHLLDPSADVTEVFRMGLFDRASSNRPRLLKVHVSSSAVAKSILANARYLKDSESFKGVFIRAFDVQVGT